MKYKVTFLDYWHLSSGLSAGAKLDSTVVRDENGLPYIPGKTIKGLIKEQSNNDKFLEICFGEEGNKIGKCHFSNAEIEENNKKIIINDSLQNQLFDEIASTKIDKENGIAESGSLREIEVVIPMKLYGEITNIPDEYKQEMINCLKKIKRMGLNRNRGLGRCVITDIGEEK